MKKMKDFAIQHKILVAVIIATLSFSLYAALSNTYDTATPGGNDDPRFADDEMRLTKAAVQERMNDHNGTVDEGDHYWPLTGTEVSNVDAGQHRMITLRQFTDDPSDLTSYSTITDLGFLYQRDVSGNGELFYEDEAANVLQMTRLGLFNLNSAFWDGTFATTTADLSDSKSITLAAGGAAGVGRGATIYFYGNEHATYPGQIRLVAGYSSGTTKAIIDASSSKISNVVDPAGAQDAATKAYVDAEMTPNPMTGSTDSIGEVTFGNGLMMKWGKKTLTGSQELAIDFTDEGLTDFSTACFQAFISFGTAATQEYDGSVHTLSISAITIKNGSDEERIIRWFAIGR